MSPTLKIRLLKIVAAVVVAPYALTLFYIFIPPVSTLMLADLATFTLPHRTWASLDKISPHLVAAVVTSEDGAFCEHFGFDFEQIEKSLDKAADGKRFGGASTITQQTAKNLFLWGGRSWVRKLFEAPLTLWLELVMSKRRILEIYLNIAEWGDGIYGAQAAAHYHFGTNAANLSPWQAALLASSLPNPIRMQAGHPGPKQAAQAGIIAARAAGQGADLRCLR